MKKSQIDHMLARPAMYCGMEFASIEQFDLFFCGLSLGLLARDSFSKADAEAISQFGRFMRHYLHGEDKNSRWTYDLLSQVGDQRAAIQKASVLLRAFRDRLESRGVDHLEQVIAEAANVHIIIDEKGQYVEQSA
jgi:hypothetical protein